MRTTLPRPEYPRPQLRRGRWANLNGTWSFAFDDNDRGRARGWQHLRALGPRSILVPFCPQSPLSGIGDPSFHDVVWYARTLVAPRRSDRERVVLHFGAVDYRAAVWVNGQLVATHEGGHTPFRADITSVLSAADNLLVVRAEDPGDDPTIPRGKQDWHQHPSHTFYSRTTGIWQTVWLEVVDRIHVSDLRLSPDVDAAALHAVVQLAGWEPGTHVRIVATRQGRPAGAATVAAVTDEPHVTVNLGEAPLRVWAPQHPTLYDLTVEVVDAAGQVRDRVTSYVGMRKVDVAGDRLLLNGHPVYPRLVLDQGYWPDGLLTAPSDAALHRDIELAMAMGFNGARKHQKVEDPRWLYWADRLGFLVWGEMANAHRFSARYVRRITREWQEVIARDYNHPSVIAWVPINESSGCRSLGPDQRTPAGPFQAHHASAMYFLTKSLDPTRPALSNDGWEHTHSDLCTVHDYRGPEALAHRLASVGRLLTVPGDGEGVYADGHTHGGQPILVTEYGGIFRDTPVDGFDYAVVDSDQEFLRRLRALTSVLLESPIISGFCYTQLSDVEHERNGLLTADRTPKIDPARVRDVIAAPHADTAGATSMSTEVTGAFPAGFLWGAATGAHQIEGGNVNSDLWELEHAPDTAFAEPSGDACDSYHRWREDLDLLAGVGLNAYRFSLEWSRIEPEEGEISRAALDHYRRMVDGCRERGLSPLVTLLHFTIPRWMHHSGGWRDPRAVDRFAHFCEATLPVVADGVDWVCTINEPNMAAMTDSTAKTATGVAGARPAPDPTISDALIGAHRRAVEVLRSVHGLLVGWTVANQDFQAEEGAEEATAAWAWPREDRFLEAAKGDDFVGVQAYTRVRIGPHGALPIPEGAEVTQTGWEYWPDALEEAIRHTWQVTGGTPIIVTENGIATADDQRRIDYTRHALRGLKATLAGGIDVRGYLHWSALDNFEWVFGFRPTFGLIAVDRTTFQRTVKPSARWLGAIATANRLPE